MVENETPPSCLLLYPCPSLDKLGGVSLAYEDLQQPELGFEVLVFAVLLRQRRAVFLLHISIGTRGEKEEDTTNIRKWLTLRNAGSEEQSVI